MRVQRPADAPLRSELPWEALWQAADDGLIACWESGRRLGARNAELAAAARAGELVELAWKGCPHPPKSEAARPAKRWGTFYYLATWQGLRGDALDIDTSSDIVLTCPRKGLSVTFTSDRRRWAGMS